MTTRTHGKSRVFRFGDFVAAVYRVWGRHRAKELVRLALNTHLIEFRGRQHFVISED